MQMEFSLDWSPTTGFPKKMKNKTPKAIPCSTPSSPIATAVIVSNSPLEFSILSYHIPLHAMSLEEQIPKAKSKGRSPATAPKKSHSAHMVHFPDDDHLVIVFEFDDDLESKALRSCYWEVFARDRARFKDRIEKASEILNPILASSHRAQVYSKLYPAQSEDSVDSIAWLLNNLGTGNDVNASGDSGSSSSTSTGKKRRRKRRGKCKKHRN